MPTGKRRSGLNPNAYTGVEAVAPPEFYAVNRVPTINDSIGYNIGTLWLATNMSTVYMLISLSAGVAIWLPLGGGGGTLNTLTGNDAVLVGPDAMNNINILGDTTVGLTTVGNAFTNTITVTSVGGVHFGQQITGNSGTATFDAVGNINLQGTVNSTISTLAFANTVFVLDIDLINTATTNDATPTQTAVAALAANEAVVMTGMVIGAKANYTAAIAGEFMAGARNVGAGAILVGAPVVSFIHDSGTGNPSFNVDVSGNNMRLMVTGEAGITYNWRTVTRFTTLNV